MSGRKKANESKIEISPEVLLRQKFLHKCKFRALTRMVYSNAYWLMESTDNYEGTDDVKRRVQKAVRSKVKKQMLSITDKTILNKAATDRTETEKKYLYRILGGLKCFKRYPTSVKRKLAALLYFKYYGPGRVIVREHHEAHALYFILTGDVTVSHLVWDDLEQRNVSVDILELHAGDMFGEISLLHHIPRTATCTTSSHCEMLALIKEDFENVLQVCVQQQWDEVQRAMASFTYFDSFDEVSRREGCIVAKMKSYKIDEIILGDGVGVMNFVYFMLTGQCQMIESIQVIETKRLGKSSFTLYDPYVSEEETELDFDEKYFANYNLESSGSLSRVQTSSKLETPFKEMIPVTMDSRKSSYKSQQTDIGSVRFYYKGDENVKSDHDSMRTSFKLEEIDTIQRNQARTFFMQVCLFNPGSTFGFGENMRDRRIVALTPVTCMLMPLVWLMQRNTANIWTRIQHYLEKKIPTKAMLFQEFVTSHCWEQFKSQVVEDVVSRKSKPNFTSIHDVPYSIRMTELLPF